jgi:hypothetical protein
MQRMIPLLLVIVLGVAVWWLWTMRPQPVSQAMAPTPTAVSKAAGKDTPIAGPPPGFRLSGLAVGEPESFVAIELPDGKSQLYRLDGDVPGLGRIVEITESGAVIEGENGRFTLQLKPAATVTPDRRRINGEEAEGETTTPPKRPGGPADTALEPTA